MIEIKGTFTLQGSAFDHLAEDTETSRITGDWPIVLSHGDGREVGVFPHYIYVNAPGPGNSSNLIEVWDQSGEGNEARWAACSDGSLAWNGPDGGSTIRLRREIVAGKVQLVASLGFTEVVLGVEE